MTEVVVFFTDSDAFGGAEQALLHTAAGLDRIRWHPVILHHEACGLSPMLERASDLNITTQCVPHMPEGHRGVARIPAFAALLRSIRPTVFNAYLTWAASCKYGLVGAAVARVPAVIATEQLFVDLSWSHVDVLKHRLAGLGIDRFIAVSHGVANKLLTVFRVPKRKIRVVHNGISLEPFDQVVTDGLRERLIGLTDRPVVMTIARLDEQKGQSYLLRAAAKVPGATFVLVGDGPDRKRLEQCAKQEGVSDRVQFLGHRDDIPELLACCDLFVLPSLYEGLPLSILEAMAAGKPVVSSAIEGTEEAVVDGETGLLVPPGEASALADAIDKILSDPELGSRLGLRGRDRVRMEFSAEVMAKRVGDVYDEILNPAATS